MAEEKAESVQYAQKKTGWPAGGGGTALIGAGLMAAGAMSNMPAVKELGLPGGSMVALGAVTFGIGVAFSLLSR